MFDFLKKPTHHHPAPTQFQQDKNEKTKQLNIKITNNENTALIPHQNKKQDTKYKKIQSNVKKYQVGGSASLTLQVQHIFRQMLSDAKKEINNSFIDEGIQKYQDSVQKRVQAVQTAMNENNYLQQLFQKLSVPNHLVKEGLDDLVGGTVENILHDIQSNKTGYQIFKKKIMTKQDLIEMQKMDQIRMIKAKQGQLSSKVGQLRMELNIIQDQKIVSKAKQIVQKDSYGKTNEKTKQVQKFLQIKKIEKQQLEKKKQQQNQKRKLKEMEQKVHQQKYAQKVKSQRHAKLIMKNQAKKILKQKNKQQVQKQRQKFAQFLKQYKQTKPLYAVKIQEQIKRQIQQKKLRFQKMVERRNNYNPLNIDELQDFQSKYLQLKRQQNQKKKIQIMIKKDQQKLRLQEMRDKHYKGKYRYLILQQMVNKQAQKQQQQFVKNLLLQKKRSYSVDVKEKYKPRIDQNKKNQSLKFISQTSRKNKKQKGPKRVKLSHIDENDFATLSYDQNQSQIQTDPKKQGKKNLRLFKQYIHDKITKGEVKRPQTFENQTSTMIPRIDYLKQQRQNRQTKNSSFSYRSLDAQSQIRNIRKQSNGDINLFKMKAQQFDEKARRQQLKLKYSQHTPHDQKQLQQNYLASIKAKLQLLSNCK